MFLNKVPTIYIGYDKKEEVAYEILRESILKYTSKYNIIPLVHSALLSSGFYRSSAIIAPNGSSRVKIDEFDGRPFSTDFTFTRFLIPALNQYDGWALFMDSDMFLRSNIEELFDKYTDESYAVACVKHDYNPSVGKKMDGQIQQKYNRKNWSSFVLWNCSHPSNLNLTVDDVNLKSGGWLHGFSWLKDEEIGSIPTEWNWLDGWSDENINPKNVHFTTGGPWFAEWEAKRTIDTHYAIEWQSLHSEKFMDNIMGDVY